MSCLRTIIVLLRMFRATAAAVRVSLSPTASCSIVAARTRTASLPHASVDSEVWTFANAHVLLVLAKRHHEARGDLVHKHIRQCLGVRGHLAGPVRRWKKDRNFATVGRDRSNQFAAVNGALYTLMNGRCYHLLTVIWYALNTVLV